MDRKILKQLLTFNQYEISLKKLCEKQPELLHRTFTSLEEFEKYSNDLEIPFQPLNALPKAITSNLTENAFILEGHDIALYKHFRYLPLLYHSHTFFEINCVVHGNCSYYTKNSCLRLATEDIVIVPPNTEHAIAVFNDDCIVLNLLLRASTFDTAFLSLLSDKDILANFFARTLYGKANTAYILFHCQCNPSAQTLIAYIYEEFNKNARYQNRMLNSLVITFFIVLLRIHEKDAIVPNPVETKNDDENIILILNYIQMQYASLSLSQLSDFFNYSERQMSRIIKDYTGFTFTELIRDLKVNKAAQMLKNPDISIQEIIETVGYNDVSHFYRVFKKVFQCTPVDYRKHHTIM